MQLYSSDNRRGIRNGDIDNSGFKLVNNNKRRNRIERQTSSDNRKGIIEEENLLHLPSLVTCGCDDPR